MDRFGLRDGVGYAYPSLVTERNKTQLLRNYCAVALGGRDATLSATFRTPPL